MMIMFMVLQKFDFLDGDIQYVICDFEFSETKNAGTEVKNGAVDF